jgi:hypothetical protein
VELFPEAYPAGGIDMSSRKSRPRYSWFTAACLVAPAVLFGLLFAIYTFILNHVGENFLRAVSN